MAPRAVVGCKDKKEPSTEATAKTTAAVAPAATATAATTPAASAATSGEPAAKKKKKAAHRPDSAKKEAEKHPDSDKDKPISEKAGKIDSNLISSKLRKKRDTGPENQCKGVPDGAGICAGDMMAFCVGEEAYLLDCNQLEVNAGFAFHSSFGSNQNDGIFVNRA